jgi:hydrogenase nickel incorporation protein HypA/HybF
MHELSVCQALLGQVAELAAHHRASAVGRITVEVGPLSGVEPELLLSAFEFARAGGCAADAVLTIKVIEITVSCLECGVESPAAVNRLICAACGAYRTRVVRGDELRLRAVELRVSEPLPAATA